MNSTSKNYFGIVDYVVVIATLSFSFLIGVYYACVSKSSGDELMMGSRKMKILPIAASMVQLQTWLVTYLSGITVFGYPAEVYSYGIQFFATIPISAFFHIIGAYIFIPFFYELRLTSIYEYIEIRFESRFLRMLSSLTFILAVIFWSGLVLYTPSLALEAFLGFPTFLSILLVGVSGAIYTSIGGFKAVIYTDCFQFFMILFGMIAIVVKGFISAGGFTEAFKIAQDHGRINLNLDIDLFQRLNLLNILLGQGFSAITMYGSHQLQIQRYCSLPSLRDAYTSILYKIPLTFLLSGLCVVAGITIFSAYAGCDPILLKEIKRADEILPYFVIQELSFIPGMLGLFTSCVFSAVLSSISSSMNSLAAVTWKDFFAPFPYFKKMSDSSQANLIRFFGLFYGGIFIGIAFLAPLMGPILFATVAVLGAISGPICSIFIQALFMPYINKKGSISGFLVGLAVIFFIAVEGFIQKKSQTPLPTNIDSCPVSKLNATFYDSQSDEFLTTIWPIFSTTPLPGLASEMGVLEKIGSISYILYPFIGAICTVVPAILVSVFTGGLSEKHRKKVDPHLHQWLRKYKVDSYSSQNKDMHVEAKL